MADQEKKQHDDDCFCTSCWARGEGAWKGTPMITPEELERRKKEAN